jgi:AcrR family transcriptional regulator
MGKRAYRMQKRAETRDETRERILQATMLLHDEKGVATTTFSDIAERAKVGPATVYRNFPTLGALVQACGVHVWQDMRPPVPQEAPAVFEGVIGRQARLRRLIKTLDAFYRRGAFRLVKAGDDRNRVPELDFFLTMVAGGVEALVREAMGKDAQERDVAVVRALTDLRVWLSLREFLPDDDIQARMLSLISSELGEAAGGS